MQQRKYSSKGNRLWGVTTVVLVGILLFFALQYTGSSPTGAATLTTTVSESLNVSVSGITTLPLRFIEQPQSIIIRGTAASEGTIEITDDDDTFRLLDENDGSFTLTCSGTCAVAAMNGSLRIVGDVFLESIDYTVVDSNDAPVWTSEKTSFIIDKNGETTLALNGFFSDPDHDELTYLATSSEHIDALVSGETLTITPKNGFTGTQTISVIAVDSEDTTTQEITVNVEQIVSHVEKLIENSPVYVDSEIEAPLELIDEAKVIVVFRETEEVSVVDVPKSVAEEIVDEKERSTKAKGTTLDQFVGPEEGIASSLGTVTQDYTTIPAAALTLTTQGLSELAQDPSVAAIYEDKEMQLALADSVPLIKANLVHNTTVNGVNVTGKGYGICIIDTGADVDHASLTGKLLGGYDFVNSDSVPDDDHGHGTHVTGIAVGPNGVAPGAHAVPVKVCDSAGNCQGSTILAGIDYCIDNAATYNITVISASISDAGNYNSTTCPSFFDSTLAIADSLGIANVYASGNDGFTNGIAYPACSPYAISVGSTTKADAISSFTSRGALLDLLAPGSSITSLWNDGGTRALSGTSMATPHVSGAFALLKQYKNLTGGNYSVASALNSLQTTGLDISGWSRINVSAALGIESNASFYNGSGGGNESGNFTTLAILNCGDSVTSSTTLTGNVINSTGGEVCSSTGLTIDASNVVLDCAGYNVTGNTTSSIAGVFIQQAIRRANVTIRGCNIRGFSNPLSIRGDGHLVENVFMESKDHPISATGIHFTVTNNTVVRNITMNQSNGNNLIQINADSVNNTLEGLTIIGSDRRINISNQGSAGFTGGRGFIINNSNPIELHIDNSENIQVVNTTVISFSLLNIAYEQSVPNVGGVKFLSGVTANGGNLSSQVVFANNFISINSTTGLSGPANITFTNITTLANPKVLRNGTDCPSSVCQVLSFSGGVVVFNVTGFSNFTLSEGLSVLLNSTSGFNRSSDNLTYTLNATGPFNRFNITTWLVNNQSILLLNMPFDGGSNATDTLDFSTYGNNGTIVNSTYRPNGGIMGGAYHFNGTNGIRMWINATANPIYNAKANYTVEAWINLSGITGTGAAPNQAILNKGNDWSIRVNASTPPYLIVRINNLTPGEVGNTSTNVSVGNYTHVAFTYDGSYIWIYQNGREIHKEAVSGAANLTDLFLAIGADSPLGGTPFNGTIDNVRIWNRTLSAQQIYAIFDAENRSVNYRTIAAEETTTGENWTALVTPDDGTQVGTTIRSNDVTIMTATNITSLRFNSTSGNNFTTDNLTYSVTGVDNNRNISNWIVNGTSILALNTPFEGGSDAATTRDYAFGNNGRVTGAVFTTISGKAGGAYLFNGTQFINFSNAAQFNNWNNSVSLEAWVLPRSRQEAVNVSMIFSKFVNAAENKVLEMNGTGHIRLNLITEGGTGGKNVTSTGPIPLNEWSHIIGTYDGSTARLYINGILNNSNTATLGTVQDSTGHLYVGFNPDFFNQGPASETSRGFNGTIDQARIWRYNLTGEQIALIFDAENHSYDYRSIHSSMTEVGQNWSVNVTPNDGFNDGATVPSVNITIRFDPSVETRPVILNSTTGQNFTTENFTAYVRDVPEQVGSTGGFDYVYNWHEASRRDPIELAILPFDVNVTGQIPGSIRNYAFDGRGNGTLNNGTALSTAEDTTAPLYVRHSGIRGGGYQFNGNNTVINMGYDKIYTIKSSFSIETWLNVSGRSQNESQRYFDRAPGGIGVAANYRCQVGASNAAVGFRPFIILCGFGNGVSETNVNSGAYNVTPGILTQIVFTFDASTGVTRIYANGTVVGESVTGILPADSNGFDGDLSRFIIGTGDGHGGSGTSGPGIQSVLPFNGTIDSITIYNRSLTAGQILSLYNNGLDGHNVTVGAETRVGENWSVNVTPVNSTRTGTTFMSNNITIRAGEATPPSVTNVSPVIGDYPLAYVITLAANVTDDTSVQSVYANITRPDSSRETIILTTVTQDIYTATFANTELLGQYNFTIYAIDTSGNVNNTIGGAWNVTIGNLSCTTTVGACAAGSTHILKLANLTNAHAGLPNSSDYTINLCCRDTTGRNNISNSTGFNFLDTSAVTNAHVEFPNEGNYQYQTFVGADRDTLTCNYYPLTFGVCPQNNTCVLTLPENETGDRTNLHVAGCDLGNYSTSLCCGFSLGNRYIPPFEEITLNQFRANATVLGLLSNASRSLTAQEIFYVNNTQGRRLRIHGLFNQSDVNATLLTVQIDENRTFSNTSNVTGAIREHSIFIPDRNTHVGVFVCPQARNRTDIVRGCTGEVTFNLFELGGTFKSGMNATLEGTDYSVNNVTSTGVGPLDQNARLVIFDDTDPERGSQSKMINQRVFFFANYTNITSGVSINGTNIFCNMTINSTVAETISTINMTYNQTSRLYEYNTTFVTPGIKDWNVTCEGTPQAYNIIRANDTVNITADLIPPSVVNATPNGTTFNAGTGVNITVNVTDNVAVDTVIAIVTFPNGATQAVTLTLQSTDIYNVTFFNTSIQGGSHNYTIFANDTSGNINMTSMNEFFIVTANCGQSLTGSTVLGGDIQSNGSCITFGDNNATLNCAGFTVRGNGTGIAFNITDHSGITIQNCGIYGFDTGVFFHRTNYSALLSTLVNSTRIGVNITTGFNNSVRYSRITNATLHSIFSSDGERTSTINNTLNNSVTFVRGAGHSVANTSLSASTQTGVHMENAINTTIEGSVLRTGAQSITTVGGSGHTIRENTIYGGSGIAVSLINGTRMIINTNVIENNTGGAVVLNNASNSQIQNNRITNTWYGFDLISPAQNNSVKGNTITNSTEFGGFVISSENTIAHNIITTAPVGLAVQSSINNYLDNNTITGATLSLHIYNAVFTTLSNMSIPPNVVIENSVHGMINYTQSVNITTAITINDVIRFANNSVFLNSTAASGLNRSARLLFRNVGVAQAKPYVSLDDNNIFVNCPDGQCLDRNQTLTEFRYNVTHFTTYNITEGVIPSLIVILPGGGGAVTTGDVITFTALANDSGGISTVYVNVTLPNGIVETVFLPLIGGITYSTTYSNTTLAGGYVFRFFANDTSNNLNTSSAPIGFMANTPTDEGSGSGGGTRPSTPPSTPPSVSPPATPPSVSPPSTPSFPQLSLELPSIIGTPLDLALDFVCAYRVEGVESTISAINVGLNDLFQIPTGYVVAVPPFRLQCEGQDLDLTISVPHTFKDLKGLRCNALGCTDIEAIEISEDDLICGGKTLSEVRTAELLARKPYLYPTDFTQLAPYKKIINKNSPLIAIGNYRVTFSGINTAFEAGLSSPSEGIRQPQNPTMSIIGTPLVISTPQATRVTVTLPYIAPAGYDETTFGLYTLDGTLWNYKISDVDTKNNAITATFNISAGTTTVAVIGAGCDACEKVTFKKVYDGKGREAVILLHGFMSNPATWQFLLDDFARNNQPYQLWTLGYPGTQTLENITQIMMDDIEAHSSEYDKIHFVGHSLGGFIVQQALHNAKLAPEKYSFLEKTGRVILVGSPNDGSPAAAHFGELWSRIINAKTTDTIFNPTSPMAKSLGEGINVPRAPNVEYYVIAGTRPYELSIAGATITTEQLFSIFSPNDGITTTQSAQHVGDDFVNNICRDYYEVNVTHTELINHPAARKAIERILTQDLYASGKKAAGYTQYFRFLINDCSPNDQFAVIGRPVSSSEASSLLACGCGNGVCGVDETLASCPEDCSPRELSIWEQYARTFLLGFLILLLLLVLTYATSRLIRQEGQRAPGYRTVLARLETPELRAPGKLGIPPKTAREPTLPPVKGSARATIPVNREAQAAETIKTEARTLSTARPEKPISLPKTSLAEQFVKKTRAYLAEKRKERELKEHDKELAKKLAHLEEREHKLDRRIKERIKQLGELELHTPPSPTLPERKLPEGYRELNLRLKKINKRLK